MVEGAREGGRSKGVCALARACTWVMAPTPRVLVGANTFARVYFHAHALCATPPRKVACAAREDYAAAGNKSAENKRYHKLRRQVTSRRDGSRAPRRDRPVLRDPRSALRVHLQTTSHAPLARIRHQSRRGKSSQRAGWLTTPPRPAWSAMARATPPPCRSCSLAAFTMAPTSSLHKSPCRASSSTPCAVWLARTCGSARAPSRVSVWARMLPRTPACAHACIYHGGLHASLAPGHGRGARRRLRAALQYSEYWRETTL